jgi:hypothetical protein
VSVSRVAKSLGRKISPYFRIALCIAIAISLYLAYVEAVSEKSFLDYLLPRVDISKVGNMTEIKQIVPEKIHPPFVPRFVILWGFIGAATYTLKVTAKYLTDEVTNVRTRFSFHTQTPDKKFNKKYFPEHIVRLFLGTTLAVIVYFILSSGGFFGLTIDVTKLSNLNLVQYVYAVVAFIAGYSVRHIIHMLSNIANSIFMIQTEQDKEMAKK